MPPDIKFDSPAWQSTDLLNGAPPLILADLPPEVRTVIEQLVALLGLAGNIGIPTDNADAQTGQAERDAMTTDAQAKFPAAEETSAQTLQMVPQLAAGIAGALSGAMSGALQPFTQLAQQGAQVGSQAMQAGLGALQGAAADFDGPIEDLGDGFDEVGFDAGGAGADGSGGGFGDTAPAGQLGPPPIPAASTFPASSPSSSTPTAMPAPSPPGSRMPMGAMPFMPGGMQSGTPGSDSKPDTKRVVAPTVRNGAPVQGRLSPPPSAPEVTRHLQGKPVATRRIVTADQQADVDPER